MQRQLSKEAGAQDDKMIEQGISRSHCTYSKTLFSGVFLSRIS